MNAARRLQHLMQDLKEKARTYVGTTTELYRLRHGLADVFKIDDPESPEVVHAFLEIIGLVMEVEEQVRKSSGIDHDLFLRPIKSLQQNFSVHTLESEMPEVMKGFTEADLHGLEFVSERLEQTAKEGEIEEKDLKRFEQRIGRLIDDVAASGISEDFSTFLLSHLFLIRASIQNYRYFGAAGIRSSISRVVGEIILDPREATKDEKKKGLLRKTLDTIKEINGILVFLRNGARVADTLDIPELLKLNG